MATSSSNAGPGTIADGVAVHGSNGILYVRIARPEKRNALSLATLTSLGESFSRAADDITLRLAVIRGEGDAAFAAGGDIDEFDKIRSRADAEALSDLGRTAFDKIRNFPVPVVAAINGTALGGGAELALACDLRFAAAHAMIGLIHGRLAIAPSWGGGADLMRLVGISGGLKHLIAARALNAEEALEAGLVDDVAPADASFEDSLATYLESFATCPPQVMRAIKASARAARMEGWDVRAGVEREHFANVWIHEDHWSAVAAMQKARARA